MKLSFAISCALIAAVAQARLGVRCETSGGSPLVGDAQNVANFLKSVGGTCNQKNPGGSKCTQMNNQGTAAAAMCGEYNFHVQCRAAGDGLQRVIDECSHNGRVGGRFYFEKTNVALYHT